MASVTRLRPTCPCGCGGVGGCQADPCKPSSRPQMPMGVTDGSNALPGQVGEWFTANATVAYQANVPLNTNIAVGTLPAGDWDVWAYAELSGAITEIMFYLDPLPAGFVHPLGQAWIAPADTTGQVEAIDFVPQGPVGRANTTVPTALNFAFTVASQTAGTVLLFVSARRMR